MNTAPGISSRQGIYPASLESGEKGKETDAGEGLSADMAGGRSISPAAAQGSFISIASANHDASTTEAFGRISSCQDNVQTAQKTTSEMAPATPINKDGSERVQLPHELGSIAKSVAVAEINQEEKTADKEQREMLAWIKEAYELTFADKLEDGNARLEHVRQYCQQHPDDNLVAYRLDECEAYHHHAANNIPDALRFFEEACMTPSASYINLPESLFFMHLMLGANVAGKQRSEVFKPWDFYNELQRWQLGIFGDEKIKQLLDTGFGQNAHQVKIFYDGVEAIFKDDSADSEASREKFNQAINKLVKCMEDGTLPEILVFSVPMLNFAKSLKLIDQSRFDTVMEDIMKGQLTGCDCLDRFLACEAAKSNGIDESIKMYQQAVDTGYPFLELLDGLRNEKKRLDNALHGSFFETVD